MSDRPPRFLVPPGLLPSGAAPPPEPVALPPAVARQVLRVLRLREGAPLVLLGGDGREFPGQLTLRGPAPAALLAAPRSPATELLQPLHMAVSVLKGDRLDWLTQKLTELGATRLTYLITERTVALPPTERWPARLARLRRIAEEAVEQSGRVCPPLLEGPLPLEDLLGRTPPAGRELRLLLHPEAHRTLGAVLTPPGCPCLLMVGPEGGFTLREAELAAAAGVATVRLGAQVLRAETAALAAAALAASVLQPAPPTGGSTNPTAAP